MAVYVTDAARTPVGAAGGELAGLEAAALASRPLRVLLDRTGVNPAAVDELWLGTAAAGPVARAVADEAGLRPDAAVTVVDRGPASGFLAVVRAARAVERAEADVVVAGGVGAMSAAGPEEGDVDGDHAYLRETQARWLAAHERGAFQDEVVPVNALAYDDHPRSDGAGDGAALLLLAAGADGGSRLRAAAWVRGGDLPAAVRRALDDAGVALADVDLVELHEASPEAAERAVAALGADRAKVNRRGGTLAIGDPAGMSGARLIVSAHHGLRERRGGVALAAMQTPDGAALAAVLSAPPINPGRGE